MSQHFGGNASASMEGCSVEHVKREVLNACNEVVRDITEEDIAMMFPHSLR